MRTIDAETDLELSQLVKLSEITSLLITWSEEISGARDFQIRFLRRDRNEYLQGRRTGTIGRIRSRKNLIDCARVLNRPVLVM